MIPANEGDHGAARPLLDEALAIARDLSDQTAIAYLIENYAGLAAAEARPERALQLAGFAAGLRGTIGAPLPPNELARVERMVAPARASLAAAADAASASGRALSLDEAIALALAMTL